MIGRLENMDITEDWRRQEADKIRRERRFWFVALILAAFAILATWPHTSRADTISFNGRSEPAECHCETQSQPDTGLAVTAEICVSESYLCRIQGGDIECSVKR